MITGTDAAKQFHEDKLGAYRFFGVSNNGSVYKMVGKEYYLSWTDRYSSSERFVWGVIFTEYLII